MVLPLTTQFGNEVKDLGPGVYAFRGHTVKACPCIPQFIDAILNLGTQPKPVATPH